MLVDFNTMLNDSRIWIYASEHELKNEQENYIIKNISDHLKNWEAHKVPLIAGITILENRFIVVALDESKNIASGCSIDTLQSKIKEIEKDISISLLKRLNIFCRIDNKIYCVPTFNLASIATSTTPFYDLTIQRKSDLDYYLKPISEGWCANLL